MSEPAGPPAGFAAPGSDRVTPSRPGGTGPADRAPTRRAGVVPLRPLTLADILDGAFTTVRRNPRATLGLSLALALAQALVVTLAEIVVYAALPSVSVDPDTGEASVGSAALIGQLGPVLSTYVVGAVIGAVLTGMLTVVVTEDVLGRQVTIAQMWQRVRGVLGRLVVLSLIVGLVPTLALAFFVAPGVWLWGIWAVTVPALVVERRRGLSALRRSFRLIRGSFWRVWGIRALGVIVAQIVASLFVIPFGILAAVLGAGASPSAGNAVPLTYLLITAAGTVFATTITAPLRSAIDALLYVDLRIRREGMDIQLRLGGPRVGAT